MRIAIEILAALVFVFSSIGGILTLMFYAPWAGAVAALVAIVGIVSAVTDARAIG